MRKYRWLRMGAWLTVLLLAVLALLPVSAAGTETKTISDWWLTAVELKANRTETSSFRFTTLFSSPPVYRAGFCT